MKFLRDQRIEHSQDRHASVLKPKEFLRSYSLSSNIYAKVMEGLFGRASCNSKEANAIRTAAAAIAFRNICPDRVSRPPELLSVDQRLTRSVG